MGTGVTQREREAGEIEALLRLKAFPGLGDRRIRELVEVHGSGMEALRARPVQKELWRTHQGYFDLRSWLENGGRAVPLTSPRYPPPLLKLSDPPPVLFLAGCADLLANPSVAVVGSRRATSTGRRVAEEMAAILSRAGITVVSGMALGIDGAAHRGALRGEGKTVAVLGSGLGVVYPPSHRSLWARIRNEGLLVSEFLPGEPARPFHFPKRNRIIAALAGAVIVVEAGEGSGALITVDHALDLGREVLCVPGSVENPRATASNALLRDGARLLTGPDAVLEELDGLLRVGRPPPPGTHGPPEDLKGLWAVLSREPLSLDHLAREAAVTAGEALAGLSALELGGWAVRCPGMHFQRRQGLGD